MHSPLFFLSNSSGDTATSCQILSRLCQHWGHIFILRGAWPPSIYPSICPYDIPSRYDVIATLSYAVEFIVCTAADYHCLTCHTGDLKRQHLSLCCILLATMLESMRHAGKAGLYAWLPMLSRT